MSFFEFPNTRTYDSDLGWLIAAMKELIDTVDNFIDTNKIKFADPITWDITTAYEANTIVLSSAGDGYISSQAVPAGIPLSNSTYWTKIFNFAELFEELRLNIIPVSDGESATATSARSVGDLLWWNNQIYKVVVAMPIGTAYIDGENIEHVTVEGLIEEEKNSRESADTALQTAINNLNLKVSNLKIGNVKDYGATGDGVTDDTAAIQSCINANDLIFIPSGNYLLSDRLNINDKTVMGAGLSSILFRRDLNGRILYLTGINTVTDLRILYEEDYIPTDGASIEITSTNDSNKLTNIFIANPYIGISLHDMSGTYLNNITLENSTYYGISIQACNDIYMNNILMSNAGKYTTLTSAIGIYFINYVQAIECVNVNILGFATSMGWYHSDDTHNVSNSMSYSCFTNCYFDSSINPLTITNCNALKFTNCWISERATGCVLSDYANNISFNNCSFRNCNDNGAVVYSGADNILFNSCDFINNNNHGILLQTSAHDVVISGCNITNDTQYPDAYAQQVGIYIDSTNTNIIVDNCIVKNNTTANIQNNASEVSTVLVLNNLS